MGRLENRICTMTATNHTVTGIVIGLSVVNPWLAIPLAFASHFVLDSLPHFGNRGHLSAALRMLKFVLPFDMLLALGVLLLVLIIQPTHWPVAMASGIAAASPDLWSIPLFVHYLQTGKARPGTDAFARFHSKLQWGERLWGAWIELAWFVALGSILLVKV